MLRNIIFLALAHMVAATQHHGMGWGGVGWGMITFFALAHMVGATQHHLSCTCTHVRCYATSWDGVGWGGVGDDNVPCTCTHGRCYATSSFLHLHTWSLPRNIGGSHRLKVQATAAIHVFWSRLLPGYHAAFSQPWNDTVFRSTLPWTHEDVELSLQVEHDIHEERAADCEMQFLASQPILPDYEMETLQDDIVQDSGS